MVDYNNRKNYNGVAGQSGMYSSNSEAFIEYLLSCKHWDSSVVLNPYNNKITWGTLKNTDAWVLLLEIDLNGLRYGLGIIL